MSKRKQNKGVIMTQQIIDALVARYQAQKLEALSNLNIYLTAAVGVGEHPNIVDECDKLIAKVSEANERIETLRTIVDQSNQVAAQNESSDNR
tara:strand:+ start:948 stop:1226 length:279 start_codon:yes stop_codon:yes gene_type:complete